VGACELGGRAEPRSAYFLSEEARSVWEHSIPSVYALFNYLSQPARRLGDSEVC